MPFYAEPTKIDYQKLWRDLDRAFDEKLDAIPEPTRTVNGFTEPEPRTPAGLGVENRALRSPIPTFSTDTAWRQKIQMVRNLNKTENGKYILKNPFLSYIFLRSTDNANYQNLIQKTPLWRLVFK